MARSYWVYNGELYDEKPPEIDEEDLFVEVVPASSLERALALIYREAPLAVANACDEELDRSGALLGRVRNRVLDERKQQSAGPTPSGKGEG